MNHMKEYAAVRSYKKATFAVYKLIWLLKYLGAYKDLSRMDTHRFVERHR